MVNGKPKKRTDPPPVLNYISKKGSILIKK